MTGKRWNLWKQTERNSELCKLIERKPGKVNEIPLKVNEIPGSRGRKKTPENGKTAAGKTERPWCDLYFKAKNARENDKYDPTLELAMKISAFFGVSVNDIIGWHWAIIILRVGTHQSKNPKLYFSFSLDNLVSFRYSKVILQISKRRTRLCIR